MTGHWQQQLALPSLQSPSDRILVGTDKFVQELEIPDGVSGTIEVLITYQVCSEKYCLPKTELKKSMLIGDE